MSIGETALSHQQAKALIAYRNGALTLC